MFLTKALYLSEYSYVIQVKVLSTTSFFSSESGMNLMNRKSRTNLIFILTGSIWTKIQKPKLKEYKRVHNSLIQCSVLIVLITIYCKAKMIFQYLEIYHSKWECCTRRHVYAFTKIQSCRNFQLPWEKTLMYFLTAPKHGICKCQRKV